MALEPEQAGNLADHDVIGLDSKTGAQFGIVLRSQKWVEREAAEDRGVLLRLSDTGCQILSLHGFGHDDEVSGDFGGAPFCCAKRKVGQRTLERTKGGAVDGVDDDWHAGTRGSQAAQNTGFAAMRSEEHTSELQSP